MSTVDPNKSHQGVSGVYKKIKAQVEIKDDKSQKPDHNNFDSDEKTRR